MKKRIRATAIAPYKKITTSSSAWKTGGKPSISVKWEITNFDNIDVANMFESLARIFEEFAIEKETRYITNFEIYSKILPSFCRNETVLAIEIKAETSDSELK